jgi:hypothetical protein
MQDASHLRRKFWTAPGWSISRPALHEKTQYKFVTVSLPKRLRKAVSLLKPQHGGFRSEAATWIQNYFKNPLELLESSRYKNILGGDDGRGYRNMCKMPRAFNSNQGD